MPLGPAASRSAASSSSTASRWPRCRSSRSSGSRPGSILAGSYVVESIFNWPGIGKLTLDAARRSRLPDDPGRRPRGRARVRPRQLRRRPRLRGAGPAHPGRATDDRHRDRRAAVTGSQRRRHAPESCPAASCGGARSSWASSVLGDDHHARGAGAGHRARTTPTRRTSARRLLPPVWVDGGTWAHPLGHRRARA